MLICNNCDKIYIKYENKCIYCDFDNSQETNLNQDSNFFEKKDGLYILHDPFKEETITKHTKKIFIRNWDTLEELKKNSNTGGWADSGYLVTKFLTGSNADEIKYIWAKYCFHIVIQNLKSPKENIFKIKFLHQRGYNSDDVRINDIIILADNEKIKINKVDNPYSSKEIQDNELTYPVYNRDNTTDHYYAKYYINDKNSCDISADETLKICKAKNIEVRLYFSNNITVNLNDKEETQFQWLLIDVYKKSINPNEKFYIEEEAKRLRELEEKEKLRKAEAERAQKELEEKNRIEKKEAERIQRELDRPKREKRNKFLFLFAFIGVIGFLLYINQDFIKEKIDFSLLSNQIENKQTKSSIAQEKNKEETKIKQEEVFTEKVAATMTISEIDLLIQQLHSCLNLNVGVANLKEIKPVIFIEVNPDRTVKSAKVVNQERLSDPSFRTAAEVAMRAVNNPDCSPLLLPEDKYDLWKRINFTFDFSWMFN